ncbi:hypothetical protein ABB02_00206 [Clostridiaceae bacterium JG1575]|nr:hypothetical protein ABB02_00206 [Clostridiaceae bacterium JG1575]
MTEEELLKQGYRKYRGKEVDVYYHLEKCNHTGICSRENEIVFDPSNRPWIMVDLAPVDEVLRVVNECPTGALKYRLRGEKEVLPKDPRG